MRALGLPAICNPSEAVVHRQDLERIAWGVGNRFLFIGLGREP